MTDMVEKNKSKLSNFVSKKGQVIKFVDYLLPNLDSNTNVLEMKIRLIYAGGKTSYFCMISRDEEYGSKVAAIEEKDLDEILKAIESLEKDVEKTDMKEADYIENKFVTEDGFKIGYYAIFKEGFMGVGEQDFNWFITLEEYDETTEFFDQDINKIKNSLLLAREKIQAIKTKIPSQLTL
mgnify:FL=1